MKNILLFISLFTLSLSLSSCSDDSDDAPAPAGSTVSFTVDGVQKTFTNVVITQSVYTFDDLSIPTYSVLANSPDNDDYLAFQIQQDYTGPDGMYEFIYSDEGGEHSLSLDDEFTFNISTNTDTQITGTFSGSLYQLEEEPTRNFTGGSFTLNINF